MSLDSQLDRWREAGLVTGEQADRIAAYERNLPATSSRWMVWALSGLGALAIVAGLISVIAANWDEIPYGIKLLGGVLLLLGSLGAAARLQGWGRDLFLLLHGGLVLANIALVGQVYHLGGAPWRVFAVCSAFALPAIFIGQRALLTDLFLGFVLTTFFLVLDQLKVLERLAENAMGLGYVCGVLGILALGAATLGRREEPKAALRRWAFGLLAIPAVWAAIEWGIDRHNGWRPPPALVSSDYLPLVVFTVLCGALALVLFIRGKDRTAGLAALAGLLLTSLAPLVPAGWGTLRQLLGFALFAAFTIALSFAAAARRSRLWTNLFTLALAVRIFILYLELVKDLMSTGLSLLATGAVLCALAWGWWRVADRFVHAEVAR